MASGNHAGSRWLSLVALAVALLLLVPMGLGGRSCPVVTLWAGM